MAENQPRLVKATFKFAGTNNDELNFAKGDVITITQSIEGGWWEGTLNGITGWFPSNYVKDHKPDSRSNQASTPKNDELILTKRDSMVFYHNVVLENVIETEKAHVEDLHSLLNNYLKPLHTTAILSNSEYASLAGNLEELFASQKNFLTALEECSRRPTLQQKVGGIFMSNAPTLRKLYEMYCANHPKAVEVLQKRREDLNKYMESKGLPSPGIMALTTSLSNPFRRLDKYPVLLKELERHIEESHPDRGDTQRAITIYKDIANSCTEIRKMKEMQYELLTSTIQDWEGDDMNQLGEVLLLSQVIIHCENGEKKERVFLLFPVVLAMLSNYSRQSGVYQYEGKLPLGGVSVKKLEDDDFLCALEITGPMIDKMVVSYGSSHEAKQWLDGLRQQAQASGSPPTPVPPNVAQDHKLQLSKSQPSINTLQPLQPLQSVSNVKVIPSQPKQLKVTQQPLFKAHKMWSLSCLRPCPPLRPSALMREDCNRSPKGGRKYSTVRRKPVDDSKTLEDDALILQVIEAYCTSAKTRHTVNSSLLDSPHMLIAEEEKIIFEEMKGNETVIEEKSLVDTVYSIKDQLKDLRQEHGQLRTEFEEEKRARRRLEMRIRKSLKSLADTTNTWDENNPSVQPRA